MLFSFRLLCWSAVVILGLSFISPVQSQSFDVVYYAGGEAVYCDLIEVTDYTVRYRLQDIPDGEIYNELRDDIALIFKRNGDFLLPAETGVHWKAGANPDYDNIVTEESEVLSAHDIEEHEDIIYYHDALDSADGSVRTDEIVAIIYQDGSHRLFADVDDVAYALGGSLAFALPADPSTDGVASTGSVAAPLSEDSTTASADAEEEEVMEASEAIEAAEEEAVEEETVEEEEAITQANEPAREVSPSGSEPVTSGKSRVASPNATRSPQPMASSQPTNSSVSEEREASSPKEELELSDTDYEEYAAKAVNKAEYLNNYLSLLCNRTLDMYDKEQAKESALKLFVHDSTVVQVSSLHREKIDKYRIDEYLEHLILINYDKVELLWRNVQYITKFRLGPDGNYYGTITVEQVFRGIKDGKPVYEDVTQKDIEIVLGNFKKEESGVVEYAWDVFLSDIGVEETRTL